MSLPAASMLSYAEYLESKHWKARRWAMLWLTGNRCQVCKAEKDLEVHHASGYTSLIAERPEDLVVLCRRCHGILEDSLIIPAPPAQVEVRP